MRRLATITSVIGLQIMLAFLTIAYMAPAPTAHAARVWAPCANDEPVGGPCVWDGRHMGNGIGRSFIVRKSGHIDFISHQRAHRLLGL